MSITPYPTPHFFRRPHKCQISQVSGFRQKATFNDPTGREFHNNLLPEGFYRPKIVNCVLCLTHVSSLCVLYVRRFKPDYLTVGISKIIVRVYKKVV